MTKGDKKKDEIAGAIPDIPIFKSKENSPELKIAPEKLQGLLEYFSAGSEFETIAMECYAEEIQIISTNNTNDIIGHYKGMPPDTEVINEGYFILETKRILEIISKKYKNSNMLNLVWEMGKKLRITDDNGNPVEIALKSVTTISKNIPPLNRRITYIDQNLMFNKKAKDENSGKMVAVLDDDGNQVMQLAKTIVDITQSELLRAASDVDIAGVDYVIFNFEKGHCYSESGTWNLKDDTSRTDGIKCDVIGPSLNKALPKEVITIIKRLSGDLKVEGSQTKPAVGISQYIGKGDLSQEMHYSVMENKRKD